MYETHFGLKKRLFEGGIAHDTDVFRSGSHDLLVANFKVALTSPDAVITLSGPPGIGKTTLTSAALRASSTRLALAWLNGTPTNPTELLELLLIELGLNAHRITRIERLQMWRQLLNEMQATDTRVFVIVERTEDLAPEVLRALDALTAADPHGSGGANIVLLGHGGLDGYLAAPMLDSLRQRIRLRQRLEPFTAAELGKYLRHQVARAGGEFDKVFAPDAVAAIHRYSGGIARIVNNLCETSLSLASVKGRPQVTGELVKQVATNLLGLDDVTGTPVSVQNDRLAIGDSHEGAIAATPPRPSPPPAAAARAPAIPPVAPVPSTIAPVAKSASSSAPPGANAPIVVPPATPTAPNTGSAPTAPVPNQVSAPATPVATATVSVAKTVEPAVQSKAASSAITPAAPMTTGGFGAVERAAPAEYDFDGTATDIPDVSMMDFPVLTDAVELPEMPERPPPPTSTPAASEARPATTVTVPQRSAAPPPQTSTPTALATAPPTTRVDTAYAKRAAAPTPQPAPAVAAKAGAPPARPVADTHADDLHQTQTMRAISAAKSIDDISSSMAETLFGEADLDLLSAALASAGWDDSDEPEAAAPAPAPKSEPIKPPASAAAPEDDPFGLFDLGPDTPLELMDDPPVDRRRKTATQR